MFALIAPLLALLPCLPARGVDKTAAEWVTELAGSGPDAAIAALVGLGPELSAPEILKCLRTEPERHGWHAMRALRALTTAAQGKKDRALVAAAKPLAAVASDTEVSESRRLVAALAAGALGVNGKDAVEPLNELLKGDAPPAVQLGAALGLAGLGKDAAGKLKNGFKREGLMKGLWTATALACLGPEGKSAKSSLSKVVENEDSLSAFLLCRATAFALGRTAGSRAVDKSWEKRVKAMRGRVWRGSKGSLNFGGIMPKDKKAFFGFYSQQSGQPAVDIDKVSLPDAFQPPVHGGKLFTLGDGVTDFVEHLVRQSVLLQADVAADRLTSWDDFLARAEGLVLLAAFLTDIDRHVKE